MLLTLCHTFRVGLDRVYLQYNHQYESDDIQLTQENYVDGILASRDFR